MLSSSELDYIAYNESLIFCCEIGSIKTAELLLTNGGDSCYQSENYNGNSLLHTAAINDDFDMCALLLDFGASPFLENLDGYFPLDLASEPEVVRLLSRAMSDRHEFSATIN